MHAFMAFEQRSYDQKDGSQNDCCPIMDNIRGYAGAEYIGGIIAAKTPSKKYASDEPPHKSRPLLIKI